MNIIATLANFPLVSQRTTVTGDGRPSENALYDCVAACVDAMCRFWLNKPENSVFNPDHFKDVAYGENWKNDGTDASRYVEFCKMLGINLHMVSANSPAHALQLAHEYINKGIPCTFTELDPYVDTNLPQYAGWTHACCFFEDDSNGLTALDPFIGKALYKSDGAWANVLRSNQLWVAELEAIVINVQQVADYFIETDAHHWICKQTGKIIRFALLDAYKSYGNEQLCGLTKLGLPKSNEIPIENINAKYQHLAGKGIVVQVLERGVLCNDPGHLVDNPPGSGGVYPIHVYDGLGSDLLAATQPQTTGVDPNKIKNFQQALELQAHDLAAKAQALETALIVPLS